MPQVYTSEMCGSDYKEVLHHKNRRRECFPRRESVPARTQSPGLSKKPLLVLFKATRVPVVINHFCDLGYPRLDLAGPRLDLAGPGLDLGGPRLDLKVEG